jgi:hypothetical protein
MSTNLQYLIHFIQHRVSEIVITIPEVQSAINKQRKINQRLAEQNENPSVPTRRILHTRPTCSRSTYNKGKINPEYTMYSQDLPDWEIYFLTLKDYARLHGLWVSYL